MKMAVYFETLLICTGVSVVKCQTGSIAGILAFLVLQNLGAQDSGDLFENRIRPLLANNCYVCHTDLESSGLRVDSRSALLTGGKRGAAVVAGKPEDSLLIRAVRQKGNLKMPPGGPPPPQAIADLEEWIRLGADWPEAPALMAAAHEQEQGVGLWSLLPLRDPAPPPVRDEDWPLNAIDRFILARLEAAEFFPSLEAERRTFIRRATLDLLGLPPSPQEIEEFLADESPAAYARLIDRLLDSPHYGERWGRHWLDLVRYSDTAGDSADYPIPQMYKYRDYVIDSLNRDKPYDQFLREQLAGDLMPAENEEEKWERIVATGYLAISRRFDVLPQAYQHLTIADTIDNVGRALLGLSISCAQCHDHKFDPISSRDYYALYGIFSSTRYPFAGSERDHVPHDLIPRVGTERYEKIMKSSQKRLESLDAKLKRLGVERQVVAGRSDKIKTLRSREKIAKDIKKVNAKRKKVRLNRPRLEMAFAVTEGKAEDARSHQRGDPKTPGEEVPRGFLTVLGGQMLPDGCQESGRRQLADWITDPGNPLTARVQVNRLWAHHFGRGLVTTQNDFGHRGVPPSHPALLDYLASRFIENGWSIKSMHRLMMLSRTYRLASRPGRKAGEMDPENAYYSRMSRTRLDAEQIRDSILKISGELDPRMGGPYPFPHEAEWTYSQHDPFTAVYPTQRRSVYLMTQRFKKHPYLSLFDGPDPNASLPLRNTTTTPLQSLFLMNSEFVHEQARHFAGQLQKRSRSFEESIQTAYLTVFGRHPDQKELEKAAGFVSEAERLSSEAGVDDVDLKSESLAPYLRAMFASNEFLFID